jgi:hypothetical protein
VAAPEVILWLDVIRQAYEDLSRPEYRDDAEKFFIRTGSSFDWISKALELDAEKIRNRIRQFLAG